MQRNLFCLLIFAGLLFLPGCGDDDNFKFKADAGPDQNVATGLVVTLDGSASSISTGSRLTYNWTFDSLPGGSSAQLSDEDAVNPSFTADVEGAYVLALVVTNVAGSTKTDSVTITAATGNSAPVANAGADQNVTNGATVTLDGSGSSDADLDTLTYSWELTAAPADSTAALSDTAAAKPTFVADKDGDYVLQLVVNDGAVDSAADAVTITASSINSAPVASAGANQNVSTGSTVTLDGSGSSDADTDPLTYTWNLTSAPPDSTAVLSDTTAVKPTFVADKEGSYVVQLVVSDGALFSAVDSVTITAATANSAPVARAGDDQNVTIGAEVTLDGSGSSDADLNPLTYAWNLTSGPADITAVLSDATAVKPTITPDKEGDWVFQLVVNDGTVDSAADTVTIKVSSGNSAPVARAGDDQNVTIGAEVTLDGSGSSDADSDSLTYAWSFTTTPDNSTASLDDDTAVEPTFTADMEGDYVLQLVVNDGTTDSAADTITITAASGNSAPVAQAGDDQNVTTGAEVTLDGSGSSDADSNPLTYAWSFTTTPENSTASLSDATAVEPTFTADMEGDYVLQLVVNDGTVDSVADTVTISASTPSAISGILDTTFGVDGIVTDSGALGRGFSIALDSGGNVLVAGGRRNTNFRTELALWRYTGDGEPDTTFSGDGLLTYIFDSTSANATTVTNGGLVIDNADNMYIPGYNRYISTGVTYGVLWKFSSSGLLVATSSTMSPAGAYGNDMVLDSAGDIYVTGNTAVSSTSDIAVWKYHSSDLTLDTSFSTDGMVTLGNIAGGNNSDYGQGIAIDDDDNIYVTGLSVGPSNTDMFIVKYTSTGELDASFGTGGIVTYDSGGFDQGFSIVLDNAGNIYVTGDSTVIWKYDSSGALDTTFNGQGFVDNANGIRGLDIALDSAENIYVTGVGGGTNSTDMYVLKYNSDGTPDSSFGTGGVVSYDGGGTTASNGDDGRSIVIDGEDKMLVTGRGGPNEYMMIWKYK